MRNPIDFYETPRWAIDAALNVWRPVGPVCDPCAGNGALVAACADAGLPTYGIEADRDLVEQARAAGRKVHHGDGLATAPPTVNLAINPPFSDVMPWLRLAHRAPSAIVLLRLGVLAGQGRYDWWTEHQPSGVLVLSARPSFTKNGKTDASDYAWIFYGGPRFGIRWAKKP